MEKQQHPAPYLVFSGEREDEHRVYEFVLDVDFFRRFDEECPFLESRVVVRGEASRSQDTWTFSFTYGGFVTVPCDRCLEPLDCEVATTSRLFVKISDRAQTDLADDWYVLSEDNTTLDVSQHFYDTVLLSLPMRRIHRDNEDGSSDCNAEMLGRLSPSVSHSEQGIMWEQLKALKDELYKEQQ